MKCWSYSCRPDKFGLLEPTKLLTFQPVMAVSATPDDEKYFHGKSCLIKTQDASVSAERGSRLGYWWSRSAS
jgi:hypothetical protein